MAGTASEGEKPTPEDIDAVPAFPPILEEPDFQPGWWERRPNAMPCFHPSDEFSRFPRALYDHNMVFSFDRPRWQDRAAWYINTPGAPASADRTDLRKLLTTPVRKERFREGRLAAVFAAGPLTSILRRMRPLRARMA